MELASAHRACESCRALKVRCQPAPEPPGGNPDPQLRPCQRCATSGNVCVYTASRRTRRKRTDVRVRELEREIQSLGELLRNSRPPSTPRRDSPALPGGEPAHVGQLVSPRPAQRIPPDFRATSEFQSPAHDPIDAGIVSMQLATQLVGRYVSDLAPQRPLVVFPSGTSAADIRASQPILFLAVLAAAAGTMDETLGAELNAMLLRIYAERIMMQGEKSLELIQALLISTNWYYSLGEYDSLKFYQQIHMAATMAVDIGLAEPTSASQLQFADHKSLDGARTLLACYICCSR